MLRSFLNSNPKHQNCVQLHLITHVSTIFLPDPLHLLYPRRHIFSSWERYSCFFRLSCMCLLNIWDSITSETRFIYQFLFPYNQKFQFKNFSLLKYYLNGKVLSIWKKNPFNFVFQKFVSLCTNINREELKVCLFRSVHNSIATGHNTQQFELNPHTTAGKKS